MFKQACRNDWHARSSRRVILSPRSGTKNLDLPTLSWLYKKLGRTEMFQKLVNNWPLKLLALVTSFFLWAAYTAEPLAEAGYNVPVIFRNLPADKDLSGEEATQVHLVLRGRAALLRRLETADLALQVDVGPRAENEFNVQLSTAQLDLPLGAQLVRLNPRELRVKLVPRQP